MKDGQRRHEFKASHGLRKFYQTQIAKAMRPAVIGLLMGWDLGITSSYYKTTENELLQEYLKVLDHGLLTIDEKYKLKKEISSYEQKDQKETSYIKVKIQEKDDQIQQLIKKQEQFEKLIQSLINSGQLKPVVQ